MTCVLVLGVNPFEDVPGYQLLSLLRSSPRYEVIAADDSIPALSILSVTGARIQTLPNPAADRHAFTAFVARLCEQYEVSVLLPGSDAHLFALAQCLADEPQLGLLCPTLAWLASNQLMNKWDLQTWASQFAVTPPRWTFENEEDSSDFAARGLYPLMVKGSRKGAIKCQDELEAVVCRRTILRNPANDGPKGGAYAEKLIEGEEHSLFLLSDGSGDSLATFGFRKLAATQLGTTLAGQVDLEIPSSMNIPMLLSSVPGPIALEMEWRRESNGAQWLFEVNVRFPSWIGALGAYGLAIVESYIDRLLLRPSRIMGDLAPADGTVFYRLPQSGFLALESAFEDSRAVSQRGATRRSYASQIPILWKSAAPHQFRLK